MTMRYKPAAHYEIIRPGHGPIGHIRRGVLILLGETGGYSGIVYHLVGTERGGEPYISRRYGPPFGKLKGLEIVTDNGERLQLRPVPRVPEVSACPDTYAALHEVCQMLVEQGSDRAAMLVAILHSAPFDPCAVCQNRFDLVEDCPACAGYGFVPEA